MSKPVAKTKKPVAKTKKPAAKTKKPVAKTKKPAAKKKPAKSAKYPFRFYGHDPNDWFDFPVYEVRFESAPDAEVRIALAEAAERHVFGITDLDGPWLWSERFVRITSDGGMSVMEDMLKELHEIASIAQVVALHIREPGRGGWQRASVKAQRHPDPGPRYAFEVREGYPFGTPRAVDPVLPVPIEDPDVEAARSRLRRELRRADDRMRVVSTGASRTSSFSAERVEAFIAAQPALTTGQLARFAKGDDPRWHPKRPHAVMMHADYPRGLAYLDDAGERRVVAGLDDPKSSNWTSVILIGPWLDDDGRTMWFAIGWKIYRVDISDGVAREVYSASGTIAHVVVTGARWVLRIDQHLELLDPSTWTVLDTVRTPKQYLDTALGGALVIASDFWSVKGLEAWAVIGDRFVTVATYPAPLLDPRDIDGEVVCRVGTTDDYVTLDGIAGALATLTDGGTCRP